MPRRIVDYPDEYAYFNWMSSWGAILSGIGVIVFIILLIHAFKFGKKCPDNPWGEGADTLEWTLPSPPPFHNFNDLPKIK